MILIFEKTDGLRVSVDVDSIVSIEESEEYTIIGTIVNDLEVRNDYEDVVEMVAKYQNMERVNFSKN